MRECYLHLRREKKFHLLKKIERLLYSKLCLGEAEGCKQVSFLLELPFYGGGQRGSEPWSSRAPSELAYLRG